MTLDIVTSSQTSARRSNGSDDIRLRSQRPIEERLRHSLGGAWVLFPLVLCPLALGLALLAAIGCGGGDADSTRGGGGPGASRGSGPGRGRADSSGGFPGGGGPGGGRPEAGVPVEVQTVKRAPIAIYFETNGTLEAEQDVDLVTRAAGPIVELSAEEGMFVRRGQVLARIDDSDIRAQLMVSEVQLEDARATRDRVRSLWDNQLVSREELDRAVAAYRTALGEVERANIQLEYTTITAPFAGQIVERYVRFAEYVANSAPLFRLSDFDPLLCPIQVPERELSRLRLRQPAVLEVEAWPDQPFAAQVLRISPVVDADSGTVRVTLKVESAGKLRPGMFASVFLELETRPNALVVGKQALALDSLGDAVYVVDGKVARRRPVTIGFQSAGQLEIVDGIADGEEVVVVGQDGLSDSTPVEVVGRDGERLAETPPASAGGSGGGRPGGGAGGGFRLDLDDPEAVERAKGLMRQRGLTDEQIEQRLERVRERQQSGAGRS